MMMSTGVCRWLFLLISLSTWTTVTNSKEMRVVCYYTNWSVYRPGAAKFSPQNINPYLCTHLIYAFGGFTKENTLKPFDKYQDIEKGGYAKFTGLKTYNKNLKTMLAIGGWNEGSTRFSPMVANAERRKELVKNAVKFLRQNHFDGLDLDWEYPSFRDGGKPRDRDNYALLVQELREEFDRESEKTGRSRLLLTMAVPAGIEYVNKGYDIPKLTKYLDWMNILSYDYHSAFEPAVNHHAPLYSLEEDNEYNYDADLNIDYTIKHYLKLGADPNKLILGIPTYGRSYTLYNPEAFEIGSPADGPGDMGEATRENGYLAYYEICEYVKNQDWEVEQPNPDAMGPYAFKDNQWVGYDDENIVRKKSEYVAENGLGGIMFWAIDNDDFRGNCHGKPYPLIEAAKEALLNAYGITDDNLISPPAKPIKPRTRTRTKSSNKSKSEDEEDTKVAKVSNSSRRRNRNKSKAKDEETNNFSNRQKSRRKESRKTTETSTYSSLKVVTPSYTTPAPPSTPDSDGAFKCEDEGFFPHPKDCKKYFWCLSGAGDSGIIAHQFTCPAGLYFNKAADSCDYTQNVLCNKKLQKPTTTSATTKDSASTTTTAASVSFSTSRVPPKITAATSRTTFKQTTTTEAYDADDEYEYEDDEDEDDDRNESEEDPRVIKELIDLIRKAGGIEELEKQLKHTKNDASSSGPDATTQAAISKSLYERVLSKAVKNSLSSKKIFSSIQNSRGPQNDGISRSDEKSSSGKTDRGKLQYTSISRNRPSTSKSVEDEGDGEEGGEDVKEENVKSRRNFSKKSQTEYVTIRRPRVSTTTDASKSDSGFNRNKVLGEGSEEDDDEDRDDDDETGNGENNSKKTFALPQYVNIRRQRPSTTEESTTSKYTVIRRGSAESASEETDESDDTTSRYKTIRRGSTTSPSTTTPAEDTTNFKFQTRRGTTTPTTTASPDVSDNSTSKYKNFRRGTTTERSLAEKEDGSSKYKTLRRGTTTPTSIPLDTESPDISSNKIVRGVTTPRDADNDVTPKYQALIRGSTTSQYESDEVTTAGLTETSSGLSAASPTTQSPSSQVVDKTGTNINLIDELATTPLSTTRKDSLNFTTENYSKTTKLKLEESTEDKATSVSTTEITDTDTETPVTPKKRPQLLDPRPFSIGSRGSSTSAKPVTESTTQTSKVSQSNFKFRLRPKTSELHKDLDNKKNNPSTESPIPKSTLNYRSRGSSRFGLSNRNANKDSSESDEANSDEDIDSSNGEVRKRLSTTGRYIEDNRTYRPSELADLSSLTAVDFSKIKELNFGASSHRRKVRPPVSSTTTTSTEQPEDTLKTGPRTLPLARKLIESSSFGKSRRIIPGKGANDQIDSGSDLSTTTKRVRGLASRTTRQPSTTPSSEDVTNRNDESSSETVHITPRTRRIIRRFRTSTAKPGVNNIEEGVNKTSSERPSFRKPLFATQNKNQSSIFNKGLPTTDRSKVEKQSPLQRLFNKKPVRLPFALQQNKVEEEDNDDSFEDSSTEEGENIKLSESNIRENSDVNSFDTSGKQRRKLVKLVKQKSDSLHEKINYAETNLEAGKDTEFLKEVTTLREASEHRGNSSTVIDQSDENISKNETSTEASEENSITTTADNLTNVTEIIKLDNEETKTSTEPNVIVRTRKIIRKIKPTIPSVKDDTGPTGRKRKIIRRLRPFTALNKAADSNESDTTAPDEKPSSQPKQLPFRSKTTLSEVATTTESTIESEKEDTSKRLLRPSVIRPKSKSPTRISLRHYGRSTTTTPKSSEEETADNVTNTEGAAPKRIFKPFTRSTTTVKTDDTTESIKSKYISKPLFRPKFRTNLDEEATDKDSTRNIESVYATTETSTEGSIRKQLFRPRLKEQVIKSSEEKLEDEISESTEIATETAELKSTAKYLYKSIGTSGSTEQTDSKKDDINHLNRDINHEASSYVEKESTTSTTEHGVDTESSTKSSYMPFSETSEDPDGIEDSKDKPEIAKSSTSVHNSYTSPSTTNTSDSEEEDEDDEEDTGDRKRNYVSVFRSSTSTNSFDNFDSEFEEETPKFDHSLLHDIHSDDDDDDDHDFDHSEEYNYDNKDRHNEDHLSVIDELIGDTSTEFKTEAFDSSSVPNDSIEDKDKSDPIEEIIESSSIRNKLYHPDRPSFIRPRVTATAAAVEKPISNRPKYKTFSRTKSLTKETIQIHAFNNTGVDGKPETGVNKLLLTNRYKYKTIERTTPSYNTDLTSEEVNNYIDHNNTETSEENLGSEGTTDPSEITTILQILNIEDFGRTTESGITTQDNEINNSAESTEYISEESTFPTSSFESDITTRLNISDIENEIFGSTTATASADNLSTESRGIFTYAENGTMTEENVINPTEASTTEVVLDTSANNEHTGQSNNAELSVTDSAVSQEETTTRNSTEVSTTEGILTSSLDNQQIQFSSTSNNSVTTEIPSIENVTSEIPETTTEIETSTVIIPETTTPYRRRSTLRSIDARPKFTPVRRKNTYLTRSTTESGVNKFGRNRIKSTTEKSTTDPPIDITLRRIRFKSTTPLTINKSLYRYSTTEKPSYTKTNIDKVTKDIDVTAKDNKANDDEETTTEDITNEDSTVKETLTSTTALPINKFIYSYSTAASNVNAKDTDLKGKGGDDNEATEEDEELGEESEEEDKKSIIKTSNQSQFTRPRIINRPTIAKNIRRPNSPIRNNSPQFTGRSTTARIVNKPKTFSKTTETPKANEDLSDIDTEAVKTRNKNLFSKKRKMNSPLSGSSVAPSEQTIEETTTSHSTASNSSEDATSVSQEHITVVPLITELITKPSVTETTEYLTTLHHIFAEVKDNATAEATTESMSAVTTTTGKVERLIEVSRIVQVNTKEAKLNHGIKEQVTEEDEPFVDKIGVVNRVTNIQVVDGNDTSSKTMGSKIKEIHFESPVFIPEGKTTDNSPNPETPSADISIQLVEHPAKVEEIPAVDNLGKINVTNITVTINGIADILQTHSNREDRKYELFGNSKSTEYGNKNQLGSERKAEIIDGISHINIITPRPILSTEASTISLEGLFQTDSPQSQLSTRFLNSNDELLEAENSKFVNVRVLHQEENARLYKGVRDDTKFIPIKLLKQDEEVTMKAKVVEITPTTNIESIKIVPIRVEMSRKLTETLPLYRIGKQNRENT